VLALAGLMVLAGSGAPATAQEDEKVNSPNAVHDQTARHMRDVRKALSTLGTPETVYDFITPALSGPVVVLQGFTINGALKDNAVAQVKKLEWVVHVVDEIELLDVGPELRRIRRQVLATLQKQVPQAFPEGHANIRIKVTKDGDVTLIGVVSPDDQERLKAAIEQIEHITFVGSVTNHIVERTG
jgi:osmotically-inducible protein OsmY